MTTTEDRDLAELPGLLRLGIPSVLRIEVSHATVEMIKKTWPAEEPRGPWSGVSAMLGTALVLNDDVPDGTARLVSGELRLPCCNYEFAEVNGKLDEVKCSGTMTRVGYQYVCGTCRARCGSKVHPLCSAAGL
jgi:hypothetical protein